jgi:hypothetical protein
MRAHLARRRGGFPRQTDRDDAFLRKTPVLTS